MLVCEKCGYGLYRSSAQTTKQKLYYYRCLGSDAYRYRNGAVCDNRPIRQDYLDSFVWTEMLWLLDDPALIQAELDRRMEAAKRADPLRKRGESLQREQVRIQKNIDRLVTAYQESLVTLEQLRQRMPDLRRQEQAVQSELVSLAEAAADQSKYLRLVETLGEFRGRLRLRADSLIVGERQQILRLLVKEILVGKETVTIRHSIPTRHSGAGPNGSPAPAPVLLTEPSSGSYLLRSGSHHCPLRSAYLRRRPFAFLRHPPAVSHPSVAAPCANWGSLGSRRRVQGYSRSLSPLPGRKRIDWPSGMETATPFRGLRPTLALRGRTSKIRILETRHTHPESAPL
jgi:site-specific DNA recombinase